MLKPEIKHIKSLYVVISQTSIRLRWAILFLQLFAIQPTHAEEYQADTTVDRYGFKSLFSANVYDKSQPYVSQLNPRAVGFVQEYVRKNTKSLEKMKDWGRPYFDLYDQILTSYGLPRELKYLSVIESHLRSGLVSWAGAVGPWQIMDFEAKRLGLKLYPYDERTDYYKSTHAAAKLLRELYSQFGDWLLVIAAYNAGAGRVNQAIKRSGSRDFWDLQYFLPEETRNHVKKFIGTHYVFEGGGGFTTMTKEETVQFKSNQISANDRGLSAEELAQTVEIEVSGRYLSVVVSNQLLLDINHFNRLNPGFDLVLSEGKKYAMRIPSDREKLFIGRKQAILLESLRVLLEGGESKK